MGVLGDAAPGVRAAVGFVGVPQRHAIRRRLRPVLHMRRRLREPVTTAVAAEFLPASTKKDHVPRTVLPFLGAHKAAEVSSLATFEGGFSQASTNVVVRLA